MVYFVLEHSYFDWGFSFHVPISRIGRWQAGDYPYLCSCMKKEIIRIDSIGSYCKTCGFGVLHPPVAVKVTFKNRYGITLAADMYTPKNAEGKLAAIACSGPFGAVKEQVSGLYAQTMAERGFLTIAFDPSYTGESTDGRKDHGCRQQGNHDYPRCCPYRPV